MSSVCFCRSYSVQSFSRIRSEIGSCCVACPKPAAVLHGLKIRKSNGPGWEALPLCAVCFETVRQLGPVAELLWFQARGVDALGMASSRQGLRPEAKRDKKSKLLKSRQVSYGGFGE